MHETFYESLREHAIEIINFKKKSIKLFQKNHMKIKKYVIFVKKKLEMNIWKTKNIVKLEIIVIVQGNIGKKCNSKYGVPKIIV